MAFLISRGRAMKIQIPRAPMVRAPLPEKISKVVPFAVAQSEKGVDLPF